VALQPCSLPHAHCAAAFLFNKLSGACRAAGEPGRHGPDGAAGLRGPAGPPGSVGSRGKEVSGEDRSACLAQRAPAPVRCA
jgi:hypothetical protein